MNTNKKTLLQLSFMAVMIMGLVYACNKDDLNNKSNRTSTVNFYLTDAPCDYDNVFIDVQALELHTDSNGWEAITPFNSGIYDLLELSNGLDTFLASEEIAGDSISQIRLILGSQNSVVVDSMSYDLKVPSGSQSGLKLNLHMALEADKSYTVWLDFDACKSIVKTGNGKYILKPVIRAYSELTNGQLTGYVMPLNADATVHAIENGDTFSAIPDTTGYWLIGGLNGTYDVLFEAGDTSSLNDETVSGVVVPLGTTIDMDTITLQ
jgi:hypothetical protein